MDSCTYERQRDISLFYPERPCVVGCGGVGSWVSILLAMSGCSKLFIYDDDILEEHNRNRLPFCQGSVGQKKVDIVKGFIQTLRPQCAVFAIPEKLEGLLLDIQLQISDVFFECSDNYASQLALYKRCKRDTLPFIRCGYDGNHITVSATVPDWGIDNQEGYQTPPSWIVPPLIVAAWGVGKSMGRWDGELNTELRDLGKPRPLRRTTHTTRRRG